MANAITLTRAISYLTTALAGVDSSHGIEHALEVMKHAENALEVSKFTISRNDELCVLLAAAAHDLDDRKYFKTKDYENARKMMRAINQEHNEDLVITMISLVSCSSNGNRRDENLPIWMYYPRWADRICGMNVPRLIAGAMLKNKPIYIKNGTAPGSFETYIFYSESSLIAAIDRSDFENYSTPGHELHGRLISVVDHCYIVLLNIPVDTMNIYFNTAFATEKKKVITFCLTFAGQELEKI